MSFSPFALTKSWENAEDFPTYEAEESQVRADMQFLFGELEAGIQKLLTELQKYNTGVGQAGANSIGIDAISGVGASNVQSALAVLAAQIAGVAVGQLGPNSIETIMIKDANVTTAKLADGAVTKAKLAADSVDNTKCDFSSGLTVDGALQVNNTAVVNNAMVVGYDSDDSEAKLFVQPGIYGDTLPGTAETGRLFFLEVQEVEE